MRDISHSSEGRDFASNGSDRCTFYSVLESHLTLSGRCCTLGAVSVKGRGGEGGLKPYSEKSILLREQMADGRRRQWPKGEVWSKGGELGCTLLCNGVGSDN